MNKSNIVSIILLVSIITMSIVWVIESNNEIKTDKYGVINFQGEYGHIGGRPPNSSYAYDHPVLRFYCHDEYSKPIIEWRDMDNNKIAWIVAHDKLYEDGISKTHQHISVETVKADMNTVITRFEIMYGDDIVNAAFSNCDVKVRNLFGYDICYNLTIIDDSIMITRSYHSIGTEFNAVTDDLVTIKGGHEGDLLILKSVDNAKTVVVKHGIGNIRLNDGVDFSLSSINNRLSLMYDGINWVSTSQTTIPP